MNDKNKIDFEATKNYLMEKWGNTPCPMCKKGPWNIPTKMFELNEFSENGLIIGGSSIPLIPIFCENCGNVILVNALISGAYKIKNSDMDDSKDE